MADRGNVSINVVTTPLVSRMGLTTGLPTGNTESAMDTSFYYESSDNYYEDNIVLSSSSTTDVRPVSSSVSKLLPIGFIGQNVPTLFNVEGGGGGGPTVTTYYKMRGYYVAGAVYETWVVTGDPSVTPPSGHTLTNVVIVSTWQVSS